MCEAEERGMVSNQDIAEGVETLLRQSDPNSVTTLNGVVQQLEAKLGLDLSHKAAFIGEQINLLLRPHPPQQYHDQLPPKDHFTLQHHPQFASAHPHQFPFHFTLHPFHHPQQVPPPQLPQPPVTKAEASPRNGNFEMPKESVPAGTKRRGGPGGLNKVCSVSPELQAIVGEPSMPRTEIVKQLWVYIRKHNLQDPSNKRKIICDDALRVLFETDCTDMFKMNKLLAKHIIRLEPTKESSQAKRLKVDSASTTKSTEPTQSLDPLNSMVILCDANLQELLGCESISALGIPEMLVRHHFIQAVICGIRDSEEVSFFIGS